jgi:tetratricopeptide (TPR) repeat protein
LGFLHTLLGAIPNQYQWALSLAGMEGSVASGLAELKVLLQDEQMELYRNEILFLTAFLQMNMTNDEMAYKQLLAEIGDGYSDTYLLNFAAARLTHALGKNDLTLNILENRPADQGKFSFYYLDYLQGMTLLYKLDFEKSKQYFNRFLKNFKGNNYIKSAYHKLAWITFLQGETDKTQSYFKQVISEGSISVDEDKVALKDAMKNYITHSVLLRTRLLYDGGYYEKALVEISIMQGAGWYKGYIDEYWYRLARIESKLEYNDKEVIAHYQLAIDFPENTTNYYGPMSALQIGLIYEKQHNIKEATIYFKKCLSLSHFDYERGIHQKAKSGLARISD